MKTFDKFLCLLGALFLLRAAIPALDTIGHAGPYGARRASALAGFDLEGVPAAIDRRLGPQSTVSLGTTITSTGDFGATFWYTATYALYPRRVASGSVHHLEIGNVDRGVVVGSIDGPKPLVVTGPGDAHPGTTGRATSDIDFAEILLASAAVFGWGLVAAALIRRSLSQPVDGWLGVFLSGVFLNALIAHIGTWLQVGISVRGAVVVGAALGLAGLVHRLVSRKRDALAFTAATGTWIIVPFVVAGIAITTSLVSPVTDWDGRYVWLFHGKQLFFRGFLPLEESRALAPLQPTYPLLTPALFALGSALRDTFNERSATFLQTLVHAGVIAGIARGAASAFGNRSGSLVTALVATMTMGWSTQAYADGLLASLLILEFVELREGGERSIGWLAAACAALTKREGLVLALIVALLVRGWREWKPLALAVFPGVVHVLWCAVGGLEHELDSPRIVFSDFPARLLEIAHRAAAVRWHSSAYLFVAFCLLAVFWRAWRRTLPPLPWTALLVVLAMSAFILLTFLVTPKPLTWHLNTALPRLALHPAVFGLMAVFALAGNSEQIPSRK